MNCGRAPTRLAIFTDFFFFSSRRRHTRLVSDWSSDVCSSDLDHPAGRHCRRKPRQHQPEILGSPSVIVQPAMRARWSCAPEIEAENRKSRAQQMRGAGANVNAVLATGEDRKSVV